MSFNPNEFLELVKKTAAGVFAASNPTDMCFGTVATVSPLTITVDQKMTLTEAQLILTNNVRDYTIEMTADGHQTENDIIGGGVDPHAHTYKGKKKWTVHLALKPGEQVILFRCNGGQKFVVFDRKEAPS